MEAYRFTFQNGRVPPDRWPTTRLRPSRMCVQEQTRHDLHPDNAPLTPDTTAMALHTPTQCQFETWASEVIRQPT